MLGTERHESRRIDNQLRGRSGRQGDPGESRASISRLDDELMRLFATGAMQWVMGRALPDDVPIEAKMVTQGHRAGAEHRRAAQRRDPQERPQVRRGDERAAQGHLPAPRSDPRRRSTCKDEALKYLADAVDTIDRHVLRRPTSTTSGTSRASSTSCRASTRPTLTIDDLGECHTTDEIYDKVMAEAAEYYERREAGVRRRAHARGRAPGDAAHHRPALA